MGKYPDSAPAISSLFKMGGGSFNPIQRQAQTNPLYSPPENQGTNRMGGGSNGVTDPYKTASELQRVWHSNPKNPNRPFSDFSPEEKEIIRTWPTHPSNPDAAKNRAVENFLYPKLF
jgi:hypothetical protein